MTNMRNVSLFLLAAALIGAPLTACGATDDPAAAPARAEVTAAAASTPAAEPEKTAPSLDGFDIDVKILKKQCFGSAGCNVTYRVSPAYGGPDYSPNVEWQVIYEITGGEDGPQINSFTLHGKDVEYTAEEFIQVPSSATKLRGRVTEVLKN